MFGFKLITTREMLLWQAAIEDRDKHISELKEELKHERFRAESSINLLLAKTQGVVIGAEKEPDLESILKCANIFGPDEINKPAEE